MVLLQAACAHVCAGLQPLRAYGQVCPQRLRMSPQLCRRGSTALSQLAAGALLLARSPAHAPLLPACLPACLPGLQVRTLPKVLKYLPSDKAQDARNYVNSLQYWLGGNDGA